MTHVALVTAEAARGTDEDETPLLDALILRGMALRTQESYIDAVARLAGEGAIGAQSLEDFVGRLARPRSVWLMVPAAIVEDTAATLARLLEPGDGLIDGGNSHYRDAIRRAEQLSGFTLFLVTEAGQGARGDAA